MLNKFNNANGNNSKNKSYNPNSTFEEWSEIYTKLKNSSIVKPNITIRIPISQNNFGNSLNELYKRKIERICTEGVMFASLYLLESGVIYLLYCIEEGDHGDADGYGVEPDTWIISFVETNGTIIVPFELSDDELIKEAENTYGYI